MFSKSVYLLFPLFAFGQIASGQNKDVTYNTLRYVLQHDFKISKRFLINNGFNMVTVMTPEGNEPVYVYHFEKHKGLNTIVIKKYSYFVYFFSYQPNISSSIEKEIKNWGFFRDSIKSFSYGKFRYYHKEKLKFIFSQEWTPGLKNKAMIPAYTIRLIDSELEQKHDPMQIEW